MRGINAWIAIGPFRLEPSELAKLAVIILLAKYFSQKHIEIYKAHHIVVSGLYVGLPAFLVLIQPDLGSAFIFFAIWLSMLLAVGIKRKHLLTIFLAVVVLGSVAWFSFLEPYQKSRISSFLNPYLDPRGEGYSIIQSKIPILSGEMVLERGHNPSSVICRRRTPILPLPLLRNNLALWVWSDYF